MPVSGSSDHPAGATCLQPALDKDASIAGIAPTLKEGDHFVAQVRARMGKAEKDHGSVVARIGITGQGIYPNFRIDNAGGGAIKAYDGQSFEPFKELDTNDANWSTASMNFEEITALLKKMRGL